LSFSFSGAKVCFGFFDLLGKKSHFFQIIFRLSFSIFEVQIPRIHSEYSIGKLQWIVKADLLF